MWGLWELQAATGTPGNVKWSSQCSCLMVQGETLGPSGHQTKISSLWKLPARKIHFCIQPAEVVQTLAWTGMWAWREALNPTRWTFQNFISFSFPFLSLVSEQVWPKPNPTGRFSSPRTRGMFREVMEPPSLEMPKKHVDMALEDTI